MKLKEIGAEMVAQDNRATQYPMFMVESDVRRYVVYQDDWDGKERNEYAAPNDLCEECREADELPPDCEHCSTEAFAYFKNERELDTRPGAFLTAKACQEHIDENRHHYSKPEVYAVSAWRNPELVKVMRHLIKLSGHEVPRRYR